MSKVEWTYAHPPYKKLSFLGWRSVSSGIWTPFHLFSSVYKEKYMRHRQIMFQLTNERPTWCHLLFYFTHCVLNMFRTLIYPSSGACDCVLQPAKRTPPNISRSKKSSNTQRTENKTTDVVIQQHSRKLLTMDILMFKTWWAHKKWNKIASDIKLVFHSSNTTTF